MYLDDCELGIQYLEYCRLIKEAHNIKCLDLSREHWFYPTCLLPLGLFIKINKDIKVISPEEENVSKYINLIMKNKIDSTKTYIPIIEILPQIEMIEKNSN